MLIECGHCGAPIDVKPEARVVKCRYCGSSDERERLRTVAEETPEDYKPAKEWVPPAHAPAASEGPLRYSDKNVAIWVLAGGLLVILGCTLPAILAAVKPKPKPATLAHQSILGTPADVAMRLGGTASDIWVSVPLSSDVYDGVSIAYGKSGDPVPTEVWLDVKGGAKPDPATKTNLSGRLNGGLSGTGGESYWNWDDVSISAGAQRIGGSIDKNGKEPAETRQRRMTALWGLVLGAAFDPSLEPPDGDMRALFGGGYPLGSLAKLPATTPVDQASKAALALFPGAIVKDSSSELKVTVALDHPLLKSITIDWFVRVGGTVEDVGFDLRPAYKSARADLARCLSARLGAPHEKVDDPVHDVRSYFYTLGHTQLGVSGNVYMINETSVKQGFTTFTTSYPIEEDAWEKAIGALGECRVGAN